MLVKLIALGLNPALWKNVFHHLRTRLPEQKFAAGIFSTAEEETYLQEEFFPVLWRREAPDFLLVDHPAPEAWERRLDFLQRVQALDGGAGTRLVLALSTAEQGLKQLVQGPQRVALLLHNGARFGLSDPSLILRKFPAEFPRLRVNDHMDALRLRRAGGKLYEAPPEKLPRDTLVGLSEVEAILRGGEAMEPDAWLREVQRVEKVKLPGGVTRGLISEEKGVFLFPGLPVGRVRGVELDGVTFSGLIDLGLMTEVSPHFSAFLDAVRERGQRHSRRWEECTRRIRRAQAKADLPVWCAGPAPLLNATCLELLKQQGLQRGHTLDVPEDAGFDEPALLLQLAPWADGGRLPARSEPPRVWPLHEELAPRLQGLDALLDWRDLPFAPVSESHTGLTREQFDDQSEQLQARERKARHALELTGKRIVLLQQEQEVLETARHRLDELLAARDAAAAWEGGLLPGTRQVLVFSHDPEEAGTVLQYLTGVAKKRWYDLGAVTDADALHALDAGLIADYRHEGALLLTAGSRRRLETLGEALARQTEQTRQERADAEADRAYFGEELEKAAQAKRSLARRWVWAVLADWLAENDERLHDVLDELRHQHERLWLLRDRVHQVVLLASSDDNLHALSKACLKLYPGFDPERSHIVPFSYEPAEALSDGTHTAAPSAGGGDGPSATGEPQRLHEALAEHNEALLSEYLGGITNRLAAARPDLVLVEHEPEVAVRIVEHLQRELPALRGVATILLLSDCWAPPPDRPMPWPRTRVVLLRRMGALAAADCLEHLRALYA